MSFRSIITTQLPSTQSDADSCGTGNISILEECHPAVSLVFKKDLGFHKLTPIQESSLPILLNSSRLDPFSPYSGDVVITAPTGEGKTLCYVIPIVSSLFYRTSPDIRALLLAPTRELVTQIAKVFSLFCVTPTSTISTPTSKRNSSSSALSMLQEADKSLPRLRVACLTGHAPFAVEASELRGESGESAICDIVVATPGRFLEHCQTNSNSAALAILTLATRYKNETALNLKKSDIATSAPNFTSDALWMRLKWIVLDEVDRLLEQNYQSWVEELTRISKLCVSRPQKIIASATMIQNPEKLNFLDLERPLFFVSSGQQGSFALPSTLQQFWIASPHLGPSLTSAVTKPLALMYLIHQIYATAKEDEEVHNSKKMRKLATDSRIADRKKPKIVVFCGSKQTSQRLSYLLDLHFGEKRELPQRVPKNIDKLQLCVPAARAEQSGGEKGVEGEHLRLNIKEFSSSLSRKDRDRLTFQFNQGNLHNSIDVLVCSDLLARGLDIAELDYVISYDVPDSIKSYVHRIGRTARSGSSGATYTIASQEEFFRFSKMLKSNKLCATEEKTMWDLVQKHPISKECLHDWMVENVATRKRTREARKIGLNETSTSLSYFQLLLEKLEKRLRASPE